MQNISLTKAITYSFLFLGTFDYNSAVPLTRTIINENYQQTEKSPSAPPPPTVDNNGGAVDEKMFADDGNLNNSSILIVDNVLENFQHTSIDSSSTEGRLIKVPKKLYIKQKIVDLFHLFGSFWKISQSERFFSHTLI